MKVKILYGTKIGQPDYMESVLCEKETEFEPVIRSASENGFDRFRIATIDLSTPPDFIGTIQGAKK